MNINQMLIFLSKNIKLTNPVNQCHNQVFKFVLIHWVLLVTCYKNKKDFVELLQDRITEPYPPKWRAPLGTLGSC